MRYMKNILCCIVVYCSMTCYQAFAVCRPTSVGNDRLWDNAIVNLSIADVIYDQISAIEQIENSGSDLILPLFTTINSQVTYSQTVASEMDSILATISNQLVTSESLIAIVDTDVHQIVQELQSVPVNDFGGTWTALMFLQQALTNSLHSAISEASIVEKELNSLIVLQQAQFSGTFTTLQTVINNAALTSIVLESISDSLTINESLIEHILVQIENEVITIQSSLDVIGVEVTEGFAGTFTAIAHTTLIAKSAQSVLDVIDHFITVDVTDTYTSLSAIGQLVDTLESKVAVINAAVIILESITEEIYQETSLNDNAIIDIVQGTSYADATLHTVESKLASLATQEDILIELFGVFAHNISSALEEVYTIESLIVPLNRTIATFNSSVDQLDEVSRQLLSNIDALSITTFNSTLNVVESGLVTLLQTGSFIAHQINLIGLIAQTTESAIGLLQQSFNLDASAIATVASVINHLDSSVGVLNSSLANIDSTVEILETQMATIISDEQQLGSNISVAITGASLLDTSVITLGSQLSVLDSRIDLLGSKVDKLNVTVAGDQVITVTLLNDMQATWTMLNAINNTLSSIIVMESIISTQLNNLPNITVDMTGVYTAIAAIQVEATSLLPLVQTLASSIASYDAYCLMDLGPTFTAMIVTESAIGMLQSDVNVLINSMTAILNYDGYAFSIPLVGNASQTYVISAGGRYALQKSVDFNPGASTCIFINSSDVHLNLSNLVLNQTGATAGTVAIKVANGVSNISIENGTISNFTGGAIQFLGNNNVIRLNNLRLVNNGGSQLLINSANINQGASNIIINGIEAVGTSGSGDCITCNKASGLFIYNCILYNAVTPGGGLSLRGCNYVDIRNCSTNVNNAYGIAGIATANSFGMIDFAIDSCVANNNTGDGLRLAGFNQNGVVTNCVLSENSGNGIHFTNVAGQLFNSSSNYVGNNVCSRNSTFGIYLDALANSNGIVFNELFFNGTRNFQEDSGVGPNTVLGNYAYRNPAANYASVSTTINKAVLRDSTAFPSPQPTYWINADVTV